MLFFQNEQVLYRINRYEVDDSLCQRKAGHTRTFQEFEISRQMSIMMTQKITRSHLKNKAGASCVKKLSMPLRNM